MRPRTYPVSHVGSGKAACGRNNAGFDATSGTGSGEELARRRQASYDAGWEELKVEVRAFLDSGQTLPPGFDPETLEDLLRTDKIQPETQEVLRLWMAAGALIRLGVPVPGGRADS